MRNIPRDMKSGAYNENYLHRTWFWTILDIGCVSRRQEGLR